MKLSIQAESAEELRDKTSGLLTQLAKSIAAVAPEAAEALESAVIASHEHEHSTRLRHRALRDSFDFVHAAYQSTLKAMLKEMGEALDAHVGTLAKAESPDFMAAVVAREDKELDAVLQGLESFGYDAARDFDTPGGLLHGLTIEDLQGVLTTMRDLRTKG